MKTTILLCCICIPLLLLSCNNVQSKTTCNSEDEIHPDYTENLKENVEAIYSHNYNTIQRGNYITKSTSKEYTQSTTNIIDGHLLNDTSFLNSYRCMYLANEEPIVLFKNMKPKSKEDVAGIFNGGSLIEVDTIFYNTVYIDSDKAPMTFEEWYSYTDNGTLEFGTFSMTFDIWYALKINGKEYYTDYKVHNYIEYKEYLKQKDQILLICSQGTGYDGNYDLGYPDFYEIIVLGRKDNRWTPIYRSSKLDLNDRGAEEFGIGEYFFSHTPYTDSKGNFIIVLEELCKLTWSGTNLSVDWYNKENQ